MGILDNLRKKATKAVDEHGDKIGQGIDKAAGMADQRTGGRHGDKVDKASAATKDALDKLDGRDDDIPQDRPGTTPPPAGPTR
jgi:hypothetical protein